METITLTITYLKFSCLKEEASQIVELGQNLLTNNKWKLECLMQVDTEAILTNNQQQRILILRHIITITLTVELQI